MGASGAVIMGFFGAVFAAMTMYWQWHFTGAVLGIPFIAFAAIALMAAYVMRRPGRGIVPSERAARAILWSTIGEGIGLFLAANIVVNLHRPDWLMPAMALVVGLHFLPIAVAARFVPFYILGSVLVASAVAGFIARAPAGGAIAGVAAAIGLWIAAVLAVRRDWRAKRARAVAA